MRILLQFFAFSQYFPMRNYYPHFYTTNYTLTLCYFNIRFIPLITNCLYSVRIYILYLRSCVFWKSKWEPHQNCHYYFKHASHLHHISCNFPATIPLKKTCYNKDFICFKNSTMDFVVAKCYI